MSNGIGLTDLATNEDLFGIGPCVTGLADFIKECKTPMAISVQGEWGSGKTSFMKMVQENLESTSPDFECVEFNAWELSQFEKEKNSTVVMIQGLIEALGENNSDSAESVKLVLKMAASLGVGFMSSGATSEMDKLFDKGRLTQIKDLKDEFQLLVNKKAGIIPYKVKLDKRNPEGNDSILNVSEGSKRVIFFVDDIGRLEPETAIEFLEVMKSFLDCTNCVFVLAVDRAVVRQGFAAKYGDGDKETAAEIRKRGDEFFDKIIQVPFKVPTASYRVEEYVRVCLEESGVPIYNDLDVYVTLAKRSIGTNPRCLNRIFNSLALLIRVVGKERLDAVKGYKLLFAVLCLQQAYVDVYNYIVNNRDVVTPSKLDFISHASRDELRKQLEGMDLSPREIKMLQAFMQTFVEKAVDLDGSGKIDTTDVNNEIAVLKEILAVSFITS